MSIHRVRSHSADPKKSREPRRLTEKIAIMKRKEHEQSEAFEKAMKSIMEMQMARMHGGGGSMPSLQAIDSNLEYPASTTIDLQSVYRDFNEVQRTSACGDNRPMRVLSAGSSRHGETHSHCFESSPYPTLGTRQQWNSHKSDSDLQQSLMFAQQSQSINHSAQQFPSSINHIRSYTSPGDLAMLNPESINFPRSFHCVSSSTEPSCSQDCTMPGHGGSGGSLPDLTNVEFSCGLDVPLEKDDLDQPTLLKGSYQLHSKGSSPSKLMYSFLPRDPSPVLGFPHQEQQSRSSSLPRFSTSASATNSSSVVPTIFSEGRQKNSTEPDFGCTQFSTLHQQSLFGHSSVQYRPFSPHHLPNGRPDNTAGFSHGQSQPDFAAGAKVDVPVTIIINSPYTDTSSSNCDSHEPIFKTESSKPGLTPSCTDSGADIRQPMSLHAVPQTHASFFAGYPGTLPGLPSYLEAKQHQALQHRFASINMNKTDLVRSYSEENLQKVPKEKNDLMQNPFMGNLANANSVPCVYVESPNTDIQQRFKSDSPTAVDSPSTSASYASSPPSVRPYWIDHPNTMNAFVFNEWPIDITTTDKSKIGSPLSHHRSLTDLSTIPETGEISTSNRRVSLLHQLSLPTIVPSDLAVDEHLERHSGLLPLTPPDFAMEEEVVDSLLKDQVQSFDISNYLGTDPLLSSVSGPYLPNIS